MHDLRFALRQLFKSPGFTATVVLTLALGIGACTVIFSAIDSVLLNSLPNPEPDRMMIVAEKRPDVPNRRVSATDYLDWVAQAKTLESFAAFNFTSFNLAGDGEPLRLNAWRVSQGYFDYNRLPPALGRSFTAEECTRGRNQVAILSYKFWQRVFAGAPDVIGRKLLLNGEPFTVVGVANEKFARITDFGSPLDIYVPLVFSDAELQRRDARTYLVNARLKSGVTLKQAQAEMDTIAASLALKYPDTNKAVGALVVPTTEAFTRGYRPVLWSLFGAVGCVLLIACANVANLLLARASARQREMAVRAALGAGRLRLVRQLLSESVLLAVLGGAAGALLAIWGVAALQTYTTSAGLGRLNTVKLDGTMLLFTLGLSVLTGLLFGLAPAWLASRVDLQDALKQGTRGSTESGARGRFRTALVALEVAGAVLLLNGAGLFLRSFLTLQRVDPGFEPERVAVLQLFLRGQKYAVKDTVARPESVQAFTNALVERFRALPGVDSAGITSVVPFVNDVRGAFRPFIVEGRSLAALADRPSALLSPASPDYFRTMGIRLRRGRLFSEHDNASSTPVAIVSETMARQFFPNEDPIGRRIDIDNTAEARGWREIVGVVADVSPGGLDLPMPAQIYEPWAQAPSTMVTFVVRTSGNPAALVPLLKPQVYALEKDQPIAFARALIDYVDESTAQNRFAVHLLGLFSAVALVIAAVGIYGVMAYRVSQRTAEIGIRMALGATSLDVLRQVLGHGMKTVGLGLAAGIVATFALGQLVQSLLFAISPRDPLTLALIAVVVTAVGFIASWLPARRATKISPITALRTE